ncbi:hypothetical protein KDM92_05740 [Undibacterium sp. BYS107W]|uniref:Uncharacterized protein n=1 Tax=Undibacterium baiyunense TaxID=2828731 RepID=A0A941I2M0_9BURK|nr:hypothetical protein [Undibacterium baiyunense]
MLYELNAMSVADIRYHKEGNTEILEIELNKKDRLWVRLKPAITIKQEAKE